MEKTLLYPWCRSQGLWVIWRVKSLINLFEFRYRVDSLHTDTYKVRNGLNRSEAVADVKGENLKYEFKFIVFPYQDAKSGAVGGEEEEGEKKHTKRKFKGGESTLEKNVANINATKYDLEFDIDPLFQKTSAKFDDHGTKGLLMNTIRVLTEIK